MDGGGRRYLNNKGFAISGIMYAILIISLLLVVGTLKTLQNRKTIVDKLKSETVNALDSNNYSNLKTTVDELIEEVANLKSTNQTLQNNLSTLTANYNTLATNYETLQSEKTTLQNKVTALETATADTGWVNLSSYLNTGVALYGGNSKIEYRKIGKLVEIRGNLKNNAKITADSSLTLLKNIPSAIRPSYTIYAIQQGSGVSRYLSYVTNVGNVALERYGSGSLSEAGAGSWLTIHIMYTVD